MKLQRRQLVVTDGTIAIKMESFAYCRNKRFNESPLRKLFDVVAKRLKTFVEPIGQELVFCHPLPDKIYIRSQDGTQLETNNFSTKRLSNIKGKDEIELDFGRNDLDMYVCICRRR